MTAKFNLYKGEELVKSVEKTELGQSSITIDGLNPNTSYEKGTYKVSFSNDSGESEKVDVPQFKTNAIGVAEVALDVETLDLKVGETHQLKATITPEGATNKKVTYESNSEHATVTQEGLVEAVSAGEATITVTTEDGSHKDTVVVTVKEKAPNAPTNVQVTPGETTADITVE